MPPQGIEPWIFGIRDRRLTTWPQKRCLEGEIRDIILAYLTYFTRLTNQASLNRNTDVFLIYGRLDVCIPFSKIEAPKQSLLQFFSRIKAFSFFTALFISVMLYILLLLTKRSRNSAFQENSIEKI